jgi:hypothetical protein
VVIRVAQRAAPRDLWKLGWDLSRQLKKAIIDVHIRTAKPVKLHGRNELFVSYTRTEKGTSQSLLVVPAGQRTFTINTVSRAGPRLRLARWVA